MVVSYYCYKSAKNPPVIIVDPPNELLGEFLTVESSSWVCKEVPEVLREIRDGLQTEYEHSGNAHSLVVSEKTVVIETTYGAVPRICELSLEDFIEVVVKWCEYTNP